MNNNLLCFHKNFANRVSIFLLLLDPLKIYLDILDFKSLSKKILLVKILVCNQFRYYLRIIFSVLSCKYYCILYFLLFLQYFMKILIYLLVINRLLLQHFFTKLFKNFIDRFVNLE